MEHQDQRGRNIVNYFYSLFHKTYSDSKGSQLAFTRSFILFSLITICSITNLVLFLFILNFKTRFFIGFCVFLLIMVSHFFLKGFKIVSYVENYSKIKTNLIVFLWSLFSILLFIISVVLEVLVGRQA